MYRFWRTIIRPALKMVNAKSVIEIGSQNGYTTKKLIEFMDVFEGEVHSIDPFPNFDYESWQREYPGTFFMHIGLSLEVLPELPPYDVYLIDGDHNWYTVYNELQLIKKVNEDKEVLIILHDIGWPYARRDLYYNPDNIPAEHRHPYEQKGIKYGYEELQDGGINAELCNAKDFNTPKNGVLTAIEDFIREAGDYEFVSIDCCNGLGIIKKKNSYDNVFAFLEENRTLKDVIRQTEENRLEFFQQRYHYKKSYENTLNAYNNEKQKHLRENEDLKKQTNDYKEQINECKGQISEYVEQIDEYKKQINGYEDQIKKYSGESVEKIKELNLLVSKLNQTIETNKLAAKEQNKLIKGLDRDKEILRKEGKEARKKCRDLEKQLQSIINSRKYKGMCYLDQVYHAPYKIVFFPFKLVRWAARKAKRHFAPKNQGMSLENCVLENNTMADSTNIITDNNIIIDNIVKTPNILEYDNYNLFDERASVNSVSVVVCIHNALNDVEECLNSLWEKRTFPYEIILIDDGSEKETKEYVEQFAQAANCRLHRNPSAIGYTKSANIGLKMSRADFVVLLNSDTIVTNAWVEKMLNCFEQYKETGIVSPLSNAASYQSVPEIRDSETGDWKINILTDDMTVDMMGLVVEKTSKRRYPEVAALNGFCFMIKRQVIDKIGYLDEENFPKGYGEEVDFCIRAVNAGYQLRVVDDTYIFHEKSKSFTHKTRKELGAASKPVLKEKHGDKIYAEIGKKMADCEELSIIREEVKEAVVIYKGKYHNLAGKKVAFLLTAKGGSGGANSVCQEVMGMRTLGINAFVINSSNYKEVFEKNYPEMIPYTQYFDKKNDNSLLNIAHGYDVIIGTIFTTIKKLHMIKEKFSHIKCGYYIQDYEPYFFNEKDEYFEEAKQSYTRIKDICLFAKTKWIAETVAENHGVKVNIVEPSIDTRLYNPYILKKKEIIKPVCICAMVRPKTIRRNPVGTMEVLDKLSKKYGEGVKITIFGCDDNELACLGSYDFVFENRGVLKRWEVARLLAQSDIFIDMSTYQAFGRTGLESMCLGCVPVLPKEGGADKFAVDGENSLVADTTNSEAVFLDICELIDRPHKLERIQSEGLKTGKNYNIINAAWSEIEMLNTIF